MGNDAPLKWNELPIGKLINAQVQEIKDWEYVIVVLTGLKAQKYNESVLTYSHLPYAFLIAGVDGEDTEENYIVAYLVKMTEQMYQAYWNQTFILMLDGFDFRVYHNGEPIHAYSKTPRTPSDKG